MGKTGSLRESMPQVAQWIDELRAQFGKEAIDRIVLAGKRGERRFYAAEIGPDGVMREFGTAPSGRRAVKGRDIESGAEVVVMECKR